MKETIDEIIKICDRHADRLTWAMSQLQKHTPFTGLNGGKAVSGRIGHNQRAR